MDLTIGSFNFLVGSLCSVSLLDLIKSGPSAGKTAIMETPKTLVGSSSVKLTKGSTVKELHEIMENLDLDESSSYSDMGFDETLDQSNNYSEEDFMVCYGNVSNNSEDTWKLGLELYDDEQAIFSSGSNGDVHSQYQVYAFIDDTSEELDGNNNLIINPANVKSGENHMKD
jgi:hypothetical protein